MLAVTRAGETRILCGLRQNLHAAAQVTPWLTMGGARATDRAMIMTFLQVGLGGAIGAMLRFGAGLLLSRTGGQGFPIAMLSVNVLGSFLMGLFFVWSLHRGFEGLTPFVMAGILGGFTTFSAFSLEAFTLFERGQVGAAAAYVALSVGLSIGALVVGIWAARGVLA